MVSLLGKVLGLLCQAFTELASHLVGLATHRKETATHFSDLASELSAFADRFSRLSNPLEKLKFHVEAASCRFPRTHFNMNDKSLQMRDIIRGLGLLCVYKGVYKGTEKMCI